MRCRLDGVEQLSRGDRSEQEISVPDASHLQGPVDCREQVTFAAFFK